MIKHPEFGRVCMCECHQDENEIMHFDECCNFTNQKYINKNGIIDEHRLYLLYRGDKLFPKKKRKWKAGQ